MAVTAAKAVRRSRMGGLRMLAGRGVDWITRRTGYSADQLTAGLQVGLGAFIMLAALSAPSAWNALTLQPASITPVYAMVSFVVVLQPNLGAASQFVLMRLAGAVVGGLCGLACMYLTYAANGASYAASVTKGCVMVLLLTLLSFVFGLYRFRYPRYWFAFTVATFSMPMVALNPYHQTYVEYKALFYWWLQIALGVGTAAAVSTFVFPVTAGHKVQLQTAGTLRQLAGLTRSTVQQMVSMPLGKEGLVAGVSGKLDSTNAIDTGLSAALKPLHDTAASAGASITQTTALLGVVGTEWNVYSTAHKFPREAYEILLHINRAILSSITTLLYPLQSGRLALRAVHAMQHEFQEAADLLARCMLVAADCIDQGASYADALALLCDLEERWRQLGDLCPSINSIWGENEMLTSDMLVGTLFSLGTRVRRVFFTLPEALRQRQPEARQHRYRHFKSGQAWDLSGPQEQLRQRAQRRAATPTMAGLGMNRALPSPRSPPIHALPPSPHQTLAALQLSQPPPQTRACAEELANPVGGQPPSACPELQYSTSLWRQYTQAEQQAVQQQGAINAVKGTWTVVQPPPGELLQPPDAAQITERFPPTVYLPSQPPAGRMAAVLQALQSRTGFSAEHLKLALQLAVAMAAACTLHVTTATYQALDEKTIWVVVTVCVVLESAMGGLVLKSGLRLVGTGMAGLLGIGLLGLAVLCNGGHYLNQLPKFISMTVFLPLVLAVLTANHVRYALPYGYVWSCTKFTTTIIALSGYVSESVQWITACWRLANISLGIGLDLAAATLILPVTSRCAIQHRVQEVLEALAELAEEVLVQFVQPEGQQAPQQAPQRAHQQAQQQQGLRLGPRPGSGDGSVTRSPNTAASTGTATTLGPGDSRRQRGLRPPRTPLSTSEAAELAVAALGQAGQPHRQQQQLEDALPRRQTTSCSSPGQGPSCASSLEPGLDSGSLQAVWPPGAAATVAAVLQEPLPAWQRVRRFLRRLVGGRGGHKGKLGAGDGDSFRPASAQYASSTGGSDGDLELGAVPADASTDGHKPAFLQAVNADSFTPLAGRHSKVMVPAASSLRQASGSTSVVGGSKQGSPLTGRLGVPTPGQSPVPSQAVAASPQAPPLSLGQSALAVAQPEPPIPSTSPASSDAQQQRPSYQQEEQEELPSPRSEPSPFTRYSSTSPPQGLPDVGIQAAIAVGDLPALPPLHIPSHHSLAAADGASTPVDGAASVVGGAAVLPSKVVLIASQPDTASSSAGWCGTPSGATAAARDQQLDVAAASSGLAPPAIARRASASSSVFYRETPRNRRLRQRRSQWLRERALGKSVMAVHALGTELGATIAHMHELALFARFEWLPFGMPQHVDPQDILAVQHACRKLLNVLLSFPYLADASDVPHRKLLMPHPREVRSVAEQMSEALRALRLVLDGQLSVDRAVEMVHNLALQVQALLLEVEQEGAITDATHADAVLGVAALGTMFSATQTVQLLYRCVLRLLGTAEQHAAAEAAFAESPTWGASVEAILVARGVVLTSLARVHQEGADGTTQAAAEAEARALYGTGMVRGE